VVSLGWWGVIVLAGVNMIAYTVGGIVLAARVEERLLYTTTQTGESREAVEALARRLRKRPELASLGAVERAGLIKLLSERAQSIDEIEAIAVPITLLQVVPRPPWPWLVARFDQLLRLSGASANESMKLADVLSSATEHSGDFRRETQAMVAGYADEALASGREAS
jgi:hypothetical protein